MSDLIPFVVGWLAASIPLGVLLGVAVKEMGRERGEWIADRRELLNRIQHPERMPVPIMPGSTAAAVRAAEQRSLRERVKADWANVGTIDAPSANGSGDLGDEVP